MDSLNLTQSFIDQAVRDGIRQLYSVDLFRNNGLAQIYDAYAQSPAAQVAPDAISAVKVIGVILSIFFGLLLVGVVIKISRLYGGSLAPHRVIKEVATDFNPPPRAEGGAIPARWGEIIRHIDSIKEGEWKLAVIEADKLVDEILRKAGYAGDSMGDRLMGIAPDQLTSIQDLWDAHKIRNLIAHATDYSLRYGQARDAIRKYEKSLRELGAL